MTVDPLDGLRAEQVYLFRHALLREVAYQLQPLAERALLHRNALDAYEAVVPQNDAYAEELADHARAAQAAGNDAQVAAREAGYLDRAGGFATRQFRNEDALGLFARLAGHQYAAAATRVHAATMCAEACQRIGRGREAAQFARQALDLAGDDETLKLTAEKQIAWVDAGYGRVEDAWRRFQQCLPRLRALGNKRRLASALSDAGTYARRLGRMDEALAIMRESLLVAIELNDLRGQGAVRANLAGVLLYKHEYADAIREAEEAASIAERRGDLQNLAVAVATLGSTHRAAGRLPEAEQYLTRAAELSRKVGNRDGLATALGNLALIRHDQIRYDEARALLQQALELNRESGDVHGECLNLGNLAENLHRQGHLAEAARGFEHALELARKSRYVMAEGYWTASLGLVAYDRERLEEAEEWLSQATPLAEGLGDKRLRGQVLAHRAMILRARRDPGADALWEEACTVLGTLRREVSELREKWDRIKVSG